MKKVLALVPLAAAATFASTGSSTGIDSSTVGLATSGIIATGVAVASGIGGVIAIAAGIRLLVKGINRAVGK